MNVQTAVEIVEAFARTDTQAFRSERKAMLLVCAALEQAEETRNAAQQCATDETLRRRTAEQKLKAIGLIVEHGTTHRWSSIHAVCENIRNILKSE